MIFSLIIILVLAVSLHLFVMRSIDSFEGYGGGGSFREWEQFEAKYRTYLNENNSSLT